MSISNISMNNDASVSRLLPYRCIKSGRNDTGKKKSVGEISCSSCLVVFIAALLYDRKFE